MKVRANDIFKGIDFSAAQMEAVEAKLTAITVKRGEVILIAGQQVPYQYYVYSGCLRTFYIDDAGKEHTLQFAIHDWWISDYTAFFTGGTALLNIECVQDATIYRISKEGMEQLYKEVPAVETFFRIKMERFFATFQKRILSGLAMSAKEKYKSFLKTYPNIETSIKNYHLASYLGITPESLSRVRAELAHE